MRHTGISKNVTVGVISAIVIVLFVIYNVLWSTFVYPNPNKDVECFSAYLRNEGSAPISLLPSNLNSSVQESMIQHRLLESNKIWRKWMEKRQQVLEKYPNPSSIFDFRAEDFRVHWDFFSPAFNCPHLEERVGRLGDGGKWVCGLDLLQRKTMKPCVVYSYGISGDTSFEEEILRYTNCHLRMFDPTVSSESTAVKNLQDKYPLRSSFQPHALWHYDVVHYTTLKTEMERHNDDFITILKVDVEGAEFKSLKTVIKQFPRGLPFGQLLIEFHFGSGNIFDRMNQAWTSLEINGLRAFHAEPNIVALKLGSTKDILFAEFSFLNVKVDNVFLHA